MPACCEACENGNPCEGAKVHSAAIEINREYISRVQEFEGRQTLIVPVVMLRQTVVNGAYVDLNELFAPAWNGVPVTIGHPETDDGWPVSANSPDMLDKFAVGRIFNAEVSDDRLKAEAWIDIERATALHSGIVSALEAGDQMDVSTGYFADDLFRAGTYDGDDYLVQHKNIRPDHLALLPNEQGACSWEDGCGVRANKGVMMKVNEAFQILQDWFAGRGQPDPETMIDGIIANKTTPFGETDRDALKAMSTETLAKIHGGSPGITKGAHMSDSEKAGPSANAADLEKLGFDSETAARMMAAAEADPGDSGDGDAAANDAGDAAGDDGDIAATVNSLAATVGKLAETVEGLAANAANSQKAEKAELIARITGNSAMQAETLETMTVDQLRGIEDGLPSRGFAGRGMPQVNSDDESGKGMIPPKPYKVVDNQKGAA